VSDAPLPHGRRIGLVLGGGGLTGTAFHAGVIAGLADHGWDAREAEVVVGTSAGSTSAILLRSGLPPADFVARMTGDPLSPDGHRVLDGIGPVRAPRSLGPRGRRPASPALLGALVRRPWAYRPGHVAAGLLPAGTRDVTDSVAGVGSLFEAWPARPTWIVAVRLADGARVVFGRGATASVRDAVSASCAIPGYFAPIPIDGQSYVDGGVWSTHNLDLVAGQGLDVVVVSAPMATDTARARDPGNALRVGVRARLDREAAQVRRGGTPVVVLAPDRRLREVMGTASMRIERRDPVARATRDLVSQLAAAGRLAPALGQ
jgi:NTE family protein